MKTLKLTAIFLASLAIAANAATYIIEGSSSSFSATKDGQTVGSTDQPIQGVIDAIKADAAGEPSTIQFGSDDDELDIDDASISIDNSDYNDFFIENFEGDNSFTIVNGTQTNKWYVGNATYNGATGKSAYISNDNNSNVYTITTTSVVHLYKDVVFKAGSQQYVLTFDWKGMGESNYDDLKVFLVETSVTPAAGTSISINDALLGTYNRQSSWQKATINIPKLNNGTTKRLVFSWRNDSSLGDQPPIAVDNIVIAASSPWEITGKLKSNSIEPTITVNGFVNITAEISNESSESKAIKNTGSGVVLITNEDIDLDDTENENSNGAIIKWSSSSTSYTALSDNDLTKDGITTGTVRWELKSNIGGIGYTNGTTTSFIAVPGVTVNKINPPITWPTSATITFGQTLSQAEFSGQNTANLGTFAYVSGTTKPSNAGIYSSYPVKFTPTDVENYSTPSNQNVSITVNKATGLAITNPSFNIPFRATFDGENTYNLNDITLNKTAAELGSKSYELGTFTDNENILTAAPELNGTTISFTGMGKSGTATLQITIKSQNYEDLTISVPIKASKIEVQIAGLTAQNSIYNGTPNIGVSGTATTSTTSGEFSASELVYTYTGTGIASPIATPPTNAGSYKLTVSVPETNSTYTGSKDYPFTIFKANRPAPTDNFTAKFGQTLSDVVPALPAGWAWDKKNNDVGAVGVQQHKVNYTPSGIDAVNYNSSEYTTPSASVNVNVTKADGANVSPPVSATKTHNSITIIPVTALTRQPVQYAISTATPADATLAWQTSLTFPALAPETNYYIFARAAENANYNAGAVSAALLVKTNATPTTPIGFAQAPTGNHIAQIANGINLSAKSDAVARIYGLNGNLISAQSYASGVYSISLKHLPKGMYIVKVEFGSETKMLRIPVM